MLVFPFWFHSQHIKQEKKVAFGAIPVFKSPLQSTVKFQKKANLFKYKNLNISGTGLVQI